MEDVMLQSERLFMGPMMREIMKKLLEWFNDQQVVENLAMYLPMTEMAEEKWIESLGGDRDNIVFIIYVKKEGEKIPIGTCGIHKIDWKNRDAEIGIAIGEKEYWSHGYGTEAIELLVSYAFNQLNLHRISSRAYCFNTKSIKMHFKLGAQLEGILREAVFKNGCYRDVLCFGILHSEWQARKK